MQLNQMRILTLKLTLRFEFSMNPINAFRIFILLSGQVYGRYLEQDLKQCNTYRSIFKPFSL